MACGVEWPVCARCPGVGLVSTAGRARCSRCGGEWPEREVSPCPLPAVAVLVDGTGMKGHVCASHAAHPSAAGLRVADKM
jgi:hypothetical protein